MINQMILKSLMMNGEGTSLDGWAKIADAAGEAEFRRQQISASGSPRRPLMEKQRKKSRRDSHSSTSGGSSSSDSARRRKHKKKGKGKGKNKKSSRKNKKSRRRRRSTSRTSSSDGSSGSEESDSSIRSVRTPSRYVNNYRTGEKHKVPVGKPAGSQPDGRVTAPVVPMPRLPTFNTPQYEYDPFFYLNKLSWLF